MIEEAMLAKSKRRKYLDYNLYAIVAAVLFQVDHVVN